MEQTMTQTLNDMKTIAVLTPVAGVVLTGVYAVIKAVILLKMKSK